MANRKKRLERGIDSIQEQIDLHKKKQETAIEEGDLDLADYYGKEIKGLEKSRLNKEKRL